MRLLGAPDSRLHGFGVPLRDPLTGHQLNDHRPLQAAHEDNYLALVSRFLPTPPRAARDPCPRGMSWAGGVMFTA